jgi:hypothetical protein
VVKNLRNNVHEDSVLDVPFGSFPRIRSELHASVDLQYYKSFIKGKFSGNEIVDRVLYINVLESRQGFMGSVWGERGYASVSVEAVLEDLGGSKKVISNCFSSKLGLVSTLDKIKKRYLSVANCAIRKALNKLVRKDYSADDEMFSIDTEFFSASSYDISENNKSIGSCESCSTLYDELTSHSNWKVRLYYLENFDGVDVKK